jgi:hypothetical protein
MERAGSWKPRSHYPTGFTGSPFPEKAAIKIPPTPFDKRGRQVDTDVLSHSQKRGQADAGVSPPLEKGAGGISFHMRPSSLSFDGIWQN